MFKKLPSGVRFLLSALALAALPVASQAQAFPNRPIHLYVGAVPGGPSDSLARIIARELSTNLGQSVVTMNKEGADAGIALDFVAHSLPDGYNLLFAQSGMTINPYLYASYKLRPDDFTPIGLVGPAPNLIAINATLPINSMAELVAYAKANPGKLNYGSTSSPTRLGTELLDSMAGIKMQMIPYKGMPPALTDLMGNNVQLVMSSVATLRPLRSDTRLRMLATTGAKRSVLTPDIPTVAESGVPGYTSATWYGVVGPANLPREVRDRLATAMKAILTKPEVVKELTNLGLDVTPLTGDDFKNFIAADYRQWGETVKAAGISPQ